MFIDLTLILQPNQQWETCRDARALPGVAEQVHLPGEFDRAFVVWRALLWLNVIQVFIVVPGANACFSHIGQLPMVRD
jgi:hypothetical protein